MHLACCLWHSHNYSVDITPNDALAIIKMCHAGQNIMILVQMTTEADELNVNVISNDVHVVGGSDG